MHPKLLVTGAKIAGLRCVAEIQASLAAGRPAKLWAAMLAQAEHYLGIEPYVPGTALPGRSSQQVAAANRDYGIVNAAANRIKLCALVHLLTGENRFKTEALRQLACVFDQQQWPDWRDLAHLWRPADLRTGHFMHSIGLAYDWLHASLSPSQRQWIVEGLDRRGIQPYLASIAEGASWALASGEPNNWQTCIVGGAGVAAMALGSDHPESQQIIDFAVAKFERYLDVLGPDGEYNESIGYAGSMQSVMTFFNIHRYWSGGGESRLLDERLGKFCDWYSYFMVPPGVNVPFGDTHLDAAPNTTIFAAMAAATGNPVYQWFYQQHAAQSPGTDLAAELLSYDPSIPAESPEGTRPKGRGFLAHSACWSSRTSWDPRATACVVAGKGGHGGENHGHYDAGTLYIDGYAKHLITDPGNIHYPADYFGQERNRYYNASAAGHNVPRFGGREMRMGSKFTLEVVDMAFDDQAGAAWLGDSTQLYGGIIRARRGVIHLLPGIVAVFDCCDLRTAEETSIRWHTADKATAAADNSFVVTNGDVRLAAQLCSLSGDPMRVQRGEHCHVAPFDRNRLGNLLDQKHESFVEAILHTATVRVLSLFRVVGPGCECTRWRQRANVWSIDTEAGLVEVEASEAGFSVSGLGKALAIDLVAGKVQIGSCATRH